VNIDVFCDCERVGHAPQALATGILSAITRDDSGGIGVSRICLTTKTAPVSWRTLARLVKKAVADSRLLPCCANHFHLVGGRRPVPIGNRGVNVFGNVQRPGFYLATSISGICSETLISP